MARATTGVFGILVAAAFAVTPALRETNTFEMPMLGARLPAAAFEVVNRVPRSRFSKLPKTLPIFRRARATAVRAFPTNILQSLLDQSVFRGTNVASLLQPSAHPSLREGAFQLSTSNHTEYFFVDAAAGTVSYATHERAVNPLVETPLYDSIPGFNAMLPTLLRYASAFGVDTNQLERKEDGSLFIRQADAVTVKLGGAIKFVSRRSLKCARSLEGYAVLGDNDEIGFDLGPEGRLLRFGMKWPRLEVARRSRVLTSDEMMENIRRGRALLDEMTEYPFEGVSDITLKDFRVFYYAPEAGAFRPARPDAGIRPVISFHVVLRSRNGKSEDGGLFTPLVEP